MAGRPDAAAAHERTHDAGDRGTPPHSQPAEEAGHAAEDGARDDLPRVASIVIGTISTDDRADGDPGGADATMHQFNLLARQLCRRAGARPPWSAESPRHVRKQLEIQSLRSPVGDVNATVLVAPSLDALRQWDVLIASQETISLNYRSKCNFMHLPNK
ncbi:hypothetical protein Ddc_19747 [Ditylenchus destructor]|nr:hypothetical protein Ddc_19747 [Ditylenchus destructor]